MQVKFKDKRSDERWIPDLGVVRAEWTEIDDEQVERFLSLGKKFEDYGIVTRKVKKEDED